MSNDCRFSFLSYFHRPLVGLLACLVRGADGLRGLCVALCSRLIASVSSGILFPVPCDGFLSAFLFLARCCCMSGFTPSLYRSRPTPSSFLLGYQGRGRFFLSIYLLAPSSLLLISCLALLLLASCAAAIMTRFPIVPSHAPPVRHGERGDLWLRSGLAIRR